MSLINQMLQDLDARRAAHGSGAPLPHAVRPLPAAPTSRWPLILGAAFGLVALAGGGLYYLEARLAAVSPAPTASVPLVAPPSQAVAVPAVVKEPGVSIAPGDSEAPGLPEQETGRTAGELARLSLGDSLRISEAVAPPPLSRAGRAKPAAKAVQEAPESAAKAVPQNSVGSGGVVGGESPPIGKKSGSETPVPAATTSRHERPATALPRSGAIERSEPVASARDRAEAEYRKAIAAINQGKSGEGLNGLRTALQHDALHVAARQLLVRLLLEARQVDEAMRVLESGLGELPAQIGWAMSLARLQVERGDLAAAWQTLHHSEPAAAGSADYQGFAGHVLQRLGRYREAADHYRRALRMAPAEGRWWLGLGYAIEAEGRVDEAREAWLTARRSGNLSPDLLALVEQKLK